LLCFIRSIDAERRMPLGINAAKVRSIKKFQSKSLLVSMVVVVARLLVPRCGRREYLEIAGPWLSHGRGILLVSIPAKPTVPHTHTAGLLCEHAR
jgi:hypothetical protein